MTPSAGASAFSRARDTRPLYEQLAELVRLRVGLGELRPGERLPGELELAASLGVSRPSLRESLKILQALGIVTVRHGAGVFVTAADPADIVRRLTPSPVLPPAEMRQVYEVRKVLECQAAAWAAERISDAETRAIAATVAEMQALAENPQVGSGAPLDRLAELDGIFHSYLTAATRNAVLIGLMQNMMEMIKESRRYSLGIPGRAILSVFDHKRVFDAVAAHDATMAARSMYAHIDGVQMAVFRDRRANGESESGIIVVGAARGRTAATRHV
jgi:GntR family transcriptional regulator, transcriptional repressor for pyruvate dehydrogenase complex